MRSNIKEPTLFKKILNELYPSLVIKRINGITIDSRLVRSNDIFIALKGENSDGNIFIGDALNLPINDRIEGTLATIVAGIMNGAKIVRVHDVKEVSRAVKITEKIIASA